MVPSVIHSCKASISRFAAASYQATARLIQRLALKFFYMGFKSLDPQVMASRRQQLLSRYCAVPLNCNSKSGTPIDALYIPATSLAKTGNVLVLCLNSTYQEFHPRHLVPYLENGADVVLWNPEELGAIAYSENLSSILAELRKNNPNQTIAVKGHCASSDPAIKAVADTNDPNIHLLIDRGHGDAQKLARSLTIFAGLPIVKKVLKDVFDCEGISKIQSVQGQKLFLIPQKDQLLDVKASNLTRELQQACQGEWIQLDTRDHWANWDHNAYNKVFDFLIRIRVIQAGFTPFTQNQFPAVKSGYLKTECLPFLIKTCV